MIFHRKISKKDNFVYLFRSILIAVIIFVLAVIYFYANKSENIDKIFLALYKILSLIRIYISTTFQINFNYFKVIISKTLLVIGYLVGLMFAPMLNSWAIVFLCGEVFTGIYLLKSADFMNEKPKKNSEFRNLNNEYNYLLVSKALSTSLNYLERFILPPILGTYSLSVYYASSVVSKIISLLVTPMTNVLLSYLNNIKSNKIEKYILVSTFSTIIILIPVYGVVNWVSSFAIEILYPQFLEEAVGLVKFTTLITCFQFLFSITNTFLLVNSEMRYQTYINLISLTIYLPLSIFLATSYGLKGYAIGSVLSYFIKWILSFVISINFNQKFNLILEEDSDD